MDKKQKVLIVHNYYQIPGGEDTVVANEKKLLEKFGHDVALYSRNNSELKMMSKLQNTFLPFNTVFSMRTYREVKRIIREQHIDIVHVHNTLNLISPSVYYAAFACKVPVVQTIHNFRLLCPGATLYRDGHICEDCVKKGLSCAVMHSCYRGNKLQTLACVISTSIHRLLGTYGKLNYICLTEFNKEKLHTLKQIKEHKIFVKPNFVDTDTALVPFDKRKHQFVFAGRLDKLKGINLLLEAWKNMGADAPELIICGTGPEEEWCKNYIFENQLSTVKMLGFVPNDKVKEIIAYSKALILPTQCYEGFPMTIVEAFSVGTPVCGSNIGNVGSIIKHDKIGWLFQYDSSDKLAECVQQCKDICVSVTKEYHQYFAQESNYEQLINIYSSVH